MLPVSFDKIDNNNNNNNNMCVKFKLSYTVNIVKIVAIIRTPDY